MLSSVVAAVVVSPAIQMDYIPFRGLQVTLRGVPVIQGTSFQYYEAGWTRGIFSSNWRPVTITRLRDNTIRVTYNGDNGQVVGTHDFTPTPTGLTAKYEFRWRGSKTVRLENSFAMLWAPAFSDGSLSVNGAPAPSLARPAQASATIADRMFSTGGNVFEFTSPLAKVRATVTGNPAVVFDARNYSVEWAKGRELFWLGFTERDIKPQETLSYRVDWEIIPAGAEPAAPETISPTAHPLAEAVGPETKPLPILPQPKQIDYGFGSQALPGKFEASGPAGTDDLVQEFERHLWSLWRQDTHRPGRETTTINFRTNGSLRPEEYRLEVGADSITLEARGEAGWRHGLKTLAFLAKAQAGRLVFPQVTVRDWPSVAWRGVHMFVGPVALEFQGRLMDRVLAPFKYNHVVLQCERTDWQATPGIKTAITMSRPDLVSLFGRYREAGIEPIPLIQSFGHVGWLFANGKNLDIALNRDVPFTVDPRKQKTRDLLTSLWDEAISVLKPKTVHFGLDEIDMRGVPADPYFTTRLWKQHVPFLLNYAQRKGVTPMMWGDIMLGPGEAPDAMHAKTVEEAKERRAVIGKGVMIADWHYKDDPNPDIYTSLELWKREGQIPIASHWNRPGNIRGQTLAAIRAGAGILQTTWAGYESNEANMIREFPQFAAYLLAADYAWSGRTETVDKLPYQAEAVLQRLFFAPPSAIRGFGGHAFSAGHAKTFKVGAVTFREDGPRILHSMISRRAVGTPAQLTVSINQAGSEVALAMDTLAWVGETESVARITIHMASGKKVTHDIAYGTDVRAANDSRATMRTARSGSVSAVRIPLGSDRGMIKDVVIARTHPAAGVTLHGVTVVQ